MRREREVQMEKYFDEVLMTVGSESTHSQSAGIHTAPSPDIAGVSNIGI